jgi:hypothetical protein
VIPLLSSCHPTSRLPCHALLRDQVWRSADLWHRLFSLTTSYDTSSTQLATNSTTYTRTILTHTFKPTLTLFFHAPFLHIHILKDLP